MSCLSSFFKEIINDLKVYVIIISLFTFYFFAIPGLLVSMQYIYNNHLWYY